MRLLAMIFGILVLAAPVAADPVDGKWTGSIDTPNGAVQIGFTFKADGSALTGSTTGPDGTEITIKNGKLDGDKIAFDVDLDFGGMAFTLSYKGVVATDQITLTADFMGMPFELVVKRAQ
jgi:hypothetical protein